MLIEQALEVIDEVRNLISVNAYCAITERLKELPSAEPNILDDGTLTITVPHGMLSKVNRVIVDEVGTKFCKIMYQDALPSAERKGKWIQISPAKIYECSECGQNVMTNDIDCYKYCHGCGARMVNEE